MVLDAATKDKIRKQVEFYFSDSNLPRDAFLREKVESDKDGFVDVALLCIFSRMNQLLMTSNKDASKVPAEKVAEVAEALEGSDKLTLSEDKTRVRRTEALRSTEEVTKEVDGRSLYAAPFPFDTSLDTLTGFFSRAGAVNCVRMRRHLTSKDFKGSVFVEFASKEEADKVAAMSLEFEGAPILLEPKLAYMQRKADERHAKPNSPFNKAEEGEAAAEPSAPPAADGGEAVMEEDAAEPAAEPAAKAADAAVPDYTPGCLLHFDFGGEELGDDVKFGTVKDSFGGRDGGVGFVDYQQGQQTGHVRFRDPEQAQEVLGKLEEGTMLVAGVKAAVRLVEGEEEKAYMVKAAKEREARNAAGGGRGGRGGGRGRGRGRGGRGGGGRGRGGSGGRGRGQKRQRDD
ncbi:hypothetical protein N2152v2_003132 [Parachlorella kessleri]